MIYKTVHGIGEDTHIEKKSRFIGSIKYCSTEEEAIDFIKEIKTKYPDARHHTYAYIIGENKGIQRYSDDSEPQGTAGIPILEVLKKEDLTNVCIVVTRYFGGVLLGKGGLIRAYTKGANIALNTLSIATVKQFQKIELIFNYNYLANLENATIQENWILREKEYLDVLHFTYFIEIDKVDQFKEKILNLTNGEITFIDGEVEQLKECDGEIIR